MSAGICCITIFIEVCGALNPQSESFRPWTSGQPGRLFWKMPGGITVCLLNN